MENVYALVKRFYAEYGRANIFVARTLVERYLRTGAWRGRSNEELCADWYCIEDFLTVIQRRDDTLARLFIRIDYLALFFRFADAHIDRRPLKRHVEDYFERMRAFLTYLDDTGDYDIDITVHAGAGAYICGEETALLDSLEGRRGQPRLKPPFPAAEGLYARPTVINNVETISSVPGIVRNGVEWFQAMGTETSKGHVFYSLSGHISRPGQYEAPIGITGRSLMDLAGGVREGHSLKFWGVGGSSAPLFTPEQLDVPLDYAGVRGAGSMLATRAVMVFDETVSVVRVISRWTDFYQHESCGKCTPCREGTYWMRQIMHRLEAGRGRPGDVDLLYEIAGNIAGRSFCALGDAAATPIRSGIELFRDEFEAGCTTPARELFPYEKTTLFGEVAVR